MRRLLVILFTLLCFAVSAKQRDSLSLNAKSRYPVVGLWRNSYFTTGLSLNKPVSQYSADAKFQVSLAVRLWNIKGKADIFFTYSQHSVWDIYQESCPFRESAYNPGVWAAWQVTDKTKLLFGIEHESNGMNGEESRSFNYATVAFVYEPYAHWRFGGRVWYGYYDRENIDNYYRYRGVCHFWATYHTLNERFSATALVNPTDWFRNYNVQLEAAWKMAKRGDWIPSLYVQFTSGYGDTMLEYNRYHCKVRIGISLMNNKLGLY